MTPYELARQARERAVHNYLAHCDALTFNGDILYTIDPAGGYACWLDAMKALDMAQIAATGLELTEKEYGT